MTVKEVLDNQGFLGRTMADGSRWEKQNAHSFDKSSQTTNQSSASDHRNVEPDQDKGISVMDWTEQVIELLSISEQLSPGPSGPVDPATSASREVSYSTSAKTCGLDVNYPSIPRCISQSAVFRSDSLESTAISVDCQASSTAESIVSSTDSEYLPQLEPPHILSWSNPISSHRYDNSLKNRVPFQTGSYRKHTNNETSSRSCPSTPDTDFISHFGTSQATRWSGQKQTHEYGAFSTSRPASFPQQIPNYVYNTLSEYTTSQQSLNVPVTLNTISFPNYHHQSHTVPNSSYLQLQDNHDIFRNSDNCVSKAIDIEEIQPSVKEPIPLPTSDYMLTNMTTETLTASNTVISEQFNEENRHIVTSNVSGKQESEVSFSDIFYEYLNVDTNNIDDYSHGLPNSNITTKDRPPLVSKTAQSKNNHFILEKTHKARDTILGRRNIDSVNKGRANWAKSLEDVHSSDLTLSERKSAGINVSNQLSFFSDSAVDTVNGDEGYERLLNEEPKVDGSTSSTLLGFEPFYDLLSNERSWKDPSAKPDGLSSLHTPTSQQSPEKPVADQSPNFSLVSFSSANSNKSLTLLGFEPANDLLCDKASLKISEDIESSHTPLPQHIPRTPVEDQDSKFNLVSLSPANSTKPPILFDLEPAYDLYHDKTGSKRSFIKPKDLHSLNTPISQDVPVTLEENQSSSFSLVSLSPATQRNEKRKVFQNHPSASTESKPSVDMELSRLSDIDASDSGDDDDGGSSESSMSSSNSDDDSRDTMTSVSSTSIKEALKMRLKAKQPSPGHDENSSNCIQSSPWKFQSHYEAASTSSASVSLQSVSQQRISQQSFKNRSHIIMDTENTQTIEISSETDGDDYSESEEKQEIPSVLQVRPKKRTTKLDGDGDDDDETARLSKREKNRLAAQKSRHRKRDKIEFLTKQVGQLEEKQKRLKTEVDRLDVERSILEETLHCHSQICQNKDILKRRSKKKAKKRSLRLACFAIKTVQ